MSGPLWSAREAAAATGGHGDGDWQATGISIDSRSTMAGDLFVALRGPNNDGHDHVAEAFAKGAVAAMVERPVGAGAEFVVADCMEGLAALGRAALRRAPDLRLVGITGSVGKTGTKDMLAAALAPSGKVTASQRSLNNHIGVPLTLARMPADAQYGVLEVGTNAPGEIAALVAETPLRVALITAIAPAHLEGFGSVEGVARAKSEIFEGVVEGGTAVLPADSDHYASLLRYAGRHRGIATCSFGQGEAADARLLRAASGSDGTAALARIHGREVAFRIGTPGLHLASNALAALLVVDSLGANLARACCELASWSVPVGRGTRERVPVAGGKFLLVDDSYNANPASMRAAIEGLAALTPDEGETGRRGRRLAFLGDMLELGEEERAYHAALADIEAMEGVDLVYVCGPRMRALHEALPTHRRGGWWSSASDLARRAPEAVRAGDVAMVKGSNGAGVWAVAEALRRQGAC